MNAADINQPPDYAGEAEALPRRAACVGLPGVTGRAATGALGSAPVGTLPSWLPCLSNSLLCFPRYLPKKKKNYVHTKICAETFTHEVKYP